MAALDLADLIRHRELHKYYLPPSQEPIIKPGDVAALDGSDDKLAISTVRIQSSDTALTAYAQLVALRLDARRATISLMSRGTQYVVAEGTKTLDLSNSQRHGMGDGLWLGQTSLPMDFGIGINSLHLPPTLKPTQNSCFTVCDLSKDDRFKLRPYVSGAPHLRFYGGTPITTQRGINIGCLCVLDDRPRDDLTLEQRDFLGVMARNIMIHLEGCREAEIRKRSVKMGRALAAFVDGKTERPDGVDDIRDDGGLMGDAAVRQRSHGAATEHLRAAESPTTPVPSSDSRHETGKRADGENSAERPGIRRFSSTDSDTSSLHGYHAILSPPVDDSGAAPDRPEDMLHAAYARAAHLLREAIEIDGVAFYNASVGFHPRVDVGEPEQWGPESDPSSPTAGRWRRSPVLNADEGANHTPSSSGQAARTFTSSTFHIVSNQGVKAHKRAQVLGWAMSHEPDQTRGGTFPRDPPPIEEDVLQYLFRRYPRGKLWAVDGDRILSGSDDEEIRVVPDSKARGRNRESQFSRLLTCFPGAKSILFAPLCDASSSVWIGGCFAWIKGDAPILTAEIDLAYLRAFMNSVSAEVSRVKALAVDRQTTSFISSISHELRSPLHGILGAVNFLSDTSLDSFQRGLVDSVHACGSTLHETLTSVLAYAKVNNLKQKQTRLGRHHPPATISENSATGQTDELHSLYAPTNLAVLCEEIVEMVEGAHFYSHDILHATPASTHDEPRPRSSKVTIEGVAGAPIETEGPRLLVVLNTEFRENWNFITQPGALRRIMMNIVGNALKYSQRGSIQVKLQAEDGGVDGPRSSLAPGDDDDDLSVSPVVVVFTVEDTGRGISREFLQTRLFSPFAQENAVSSTGVGLGLSIVKDLVRLLGGQIDVKSQEGRGTQVKVSIPMTRTTSATPGPMATHTMLERAVPELRQRRLAVQVHAFPPLVVTSLTTYLVDWFQSDLIPMESPSTPDLVVVNETESESYFAAEALKTVDRTPPAVLIVSMDNARWSTGRIASPPLRIVERMSYPFGAVKMAKAVLNCIHRMNLVCGAVGTASASDDRVSPLAWSVRDAQLAKEGLAIEVARKAASRAGRRSEADGYPFPDSRGLPRIISISRPSNHHLPARSSPHPALDSNVNIPSGKGRREPRILLVDDNTINLRLLQTFMKKRKYRHVDSAEDGQQAVDAVKERTEGYDIIFMDVSMPVMDGLSATRAIRGLERERREKQMQHTRATSAPTPTPSPSLIVALTGLASSHDQSEAFSSGMDLFLTKPVKFAKLGEILGEWETGGVGGVVSGGKGGGLSTGLE